MADRKITDAVLEAALRKHLGIKSLAAKELKVTRQTVQQRVEKSARLQAVISEVKETVLDTCESVIFNAIKPKRGKPDLATARWLAERLGKSRGYARNEPGLENEQLEAFVASFGGDVGKLRAALAALSAGGTDAITGGEAGLQSAEGGAGSMRAADADL